MTLQECRNAQVWRAPAMFDPRDIKEFILRRTMCIAARGGGVIRLSRGLFIQDFGSEFGAGHGFALGEP